MGRITTTVPHRAARSLLLVPGSLRRRSTSTAALRAVPRVVPDGVAAVVYDGLALLPPFNPDDDVAPLPAPVASLRAAVHAADAIVFSTPEYAGALPGAFKNLLDWTIGDDQPGSIADKPVAWLNTSPRGAAGAHRELREVLGYAHASVIEAACRSVPVTSAMVDAGGDLLDAGARERIREAIGALLCALGG
jgi:NAD(P)H-dependent FMN reductase